MNNSEAKCASVWVKFSDKMPPNLSDWDNIEIKSTNGNPHNATAAYIHMLYNPDTKDLFMWRYLQSAPAPSGQTK